MQVYVPLYHVLTGGLIRVTGLDGLMLGRSVSFLATLAACEMVRRIVLATAPRSDEAGKIRLTLFAFVAALLPLTMRPVFTWTALMRIDMLAALFSLSGFLAAIGAFSRPRPCISLKAT